MAVFVAVSAIFLGPIADIASSSTGSQTVTNETVVADYNNSVDLQGFDIDSGSETVWAQNASGDWVQATSPDDYTLDEPPGEISFNSSSTLIQDGEEVKVSYTYQASDPTTALVVGFIPVGFALIIFVVVANRVTGFL